LLGKPHYQVIIEYFPVGPIQCNCIIVADERTKEAIVVDPGDEVERISAALRRLGANVVAIVATHAHIDHVAALAELKTLIGVPVMLHEADLPLYENLAIQAAWLGVPTPPVTRIDRYLKEGERVDFGAHALRVIHTPGHSPGSLSFAAEGKTSVILSGDTLFAGGIGRTDLWGGSQREIMHSIRSKLLAFEDSTAVIPGHGPQTTIGVERRTNPFIIEQA
jgi:hydroxyacylglutathione hydrolase